MSTSSASILGGRELYVPPATTRFTSRERDRLLDTLATLDEATVTEAAEIPNDLKLGADCTTLNGGYRYSADGFRQVCRMLAPGATRLLPDMAGMRRRDIPDEFVSGALAIRFFNSLVDLRFAALAPYRLVKNRSTDVIEGIVGHTHRHLTNLSFFHSVAAAIEGVTPRPEFYMAALIGRRLITWWRLAQPFHAYEDHGTRWQFSLGYYFRNDEITGASARATLSLLSRAGVCLAPFKPYGARVNHQGREFATRLNRELHRVVTQPVPLQEWAAKLRPSLESNLGFQADMDHRTRRQRQVVLATNLRRLGVDFSVATDVVEAALHVGRSVGQPANELDPIQQAELFASRTVVDLLLCLLHLARRLDVSRREALEQAAFSILIGKFF